MATFKPPNTIRGMMKSVKDHIDHRHHKGVYEIPCSCGKSYKESGESSIWNS